MTGAGPVSIREAARRLGRDVKAVHSDVHLLLDAGILQKTDDGRIVFPFDAGTFTPYRIPLKPPLFCQPGSTLPIAVRNSGDH